MMYSPRARMAQVLLGLMGVAAIGVACAYYTRPTHEICLPRQSVTQAVGRVNAIAEQVIAFQERECLAGRMSPAECAKAELVRRQVKAGSRDAQAAVMTPGYELDWAHVMKTLETLGDILDALP